MKASHLDWYWSRFRQMSAQELAWRTQDEARRLAWRRRQVRLGDVAALPSVVQPGPLSSRLPVSTATEAPDAARCALVGTAEGILSGHWDIFGLPRDDIAAPDWFLDAETKRRAPQDVYSFQVNHRSQDETGNVKQVWELSRHHHLTVSAAAWFLTRDDRHAELVARQLRSWWRDNPFLSGVHWTSGIELGIRLIAWTWVRRLLDEWPQVAGLFEENEDAIRQLYWHQLYLAAFQSRGSSANNHVIAEASGLLVASSAFPWFAESDRWRRHATKVIERELARNTFASGLNRELASDYHCFVTELGLTAVVEAEAGGHPLNAATITRLCEMVDAAAALVDQNLNPPRQGDGDEGRGVVLDDPHANRWESLLMTGARLFGRLSWWPATRSGDVRSSLFGGLCGSWDSVATGRPTSRPDRFADAGFTLLRTPAAQRPEIWCRCDGGPHGYLSIAAHAHADALSVEVRYGGVEILADPGTYCYHGEARWRSYFRSTAAHNTLELDEMDQSQSGGPFLWVRAARSREFHVAVEDEGVVQSWSAEHDGYLTLEPPARHRRVVHLDTKRQRLEIRDAVESEGKHRWRLAFHLGPSVTGRLGAGHALLEWPGSEGPVSAIMGLSDELDWTLHRGEEDPACGWYSPRFGQKVPVSTLLGTGLVDSGQGILTVVEFYP